MLGDLNLSGQVLSNEDDRLTRLGMLYNINNGLVDIAPTSRFFRYSDPWTRGAQRLYQGQTHTPSITFRYLPPNSARFSYATEGALFISAQLSADAVSALRKVLIKLQALVYDILPPWRNVLESGARSVGTDKTVEAT